MQTHSPTNQPIGDTIRRCRALSSSTHLVLLDEHLHYRVMCANCLRKLVLSLTYFLSPAIRFAAGEKRHDDSYGFVDP